MNILSKWLEPICCVYAKWKITKKTAAISLFLIFILSLVPIFIMSFYCVASADDFTFAELTHQAWEESHSLIKVIGAAFLTVADFYINWQGFFSANFIPSLNPFIFDEGLYFISTFVSVISFVSGVMYLAYQVLKRYFNADIYDVMLVICPILLVFFQFMPSPSEWLFWFDAGQAMIYYGLVGFLLGIMFKCSAINQIKGIHIFLLVILSVVVSGTSGSSTFLLVFMMFKIIYDLLPNRKLSPDILMDFIVFTTVLIGFVVCLVAPGNSVRTEAVEGMPFVNAIIMSFAYSFVYIAHNSIIAIICLVIILVPVAITLVKKSSLSFRYPLLVAGVSYCIYASRFFSTLYSQSIVGASRHRNGYFLFEIILFVVNVFYFCGWINKKSQDKELCLNGFVKLIKKYSVVYAVLVLFIAALAWSQFGVKNPTSISCGLSVISGEASQYKDEMDERLEMYLDESVKVVRVKPLTSIPYVFKEDSVTVDVDNWQNRAIASFYKKDFVMLSEETY